MALGDFAGEFGQQLAAAINDLDGRQGGTAPSPGVENTFVIDPMKWGAVPGKVSTKAIQRACDETRNHRHGAVVGITSLKDYYVLDDTIDIPTRCGIRGMGRSAGFECVPGFNKTWFRNAEDDPEDIQITDLTLDGKGQGQRPNTLAEALRSPSMIQLWLAGIDGKYIEHSQLGIHDPRFHVANIQMVSWNGNGLNQANLNGAPHGRGSALVDRVEARQIGGIGIRAGCTDVRHRDCQANGARIAGLYADGANCMFDRFKAYHCLVGVHGKANFLVFEACEVQDCGTRNLVIEGDFNKIGFKIEAPGRIYELTSWAQKPGGELVIGAKFDDAVGTIITDLLVADRFKRNNANHSVVLDHHIQATGRTTLRIATASLQDGLSKRTPVDGMDKVRTAQPAIDLV